MNTLQVQLKYIFLCLLLFQNLQAQALFPNEPLPEKKQVVFAVSSFPKNPRPQEHGRIQIEATLQKGWYLYSIAPIEAEVAPLPTKLNLTLKGESIAEGVFYETKATVKHSPLFEVPLGYHRQRAVFYHNFRVPSGMTANKNEVSVSINYQVCSDKVCLPPSQAILHHSFSIEDGAVRAEFSQPRYDVEVITPDFEWSWQTIQFLILAFASGLLALLTPCVFPMFPITVGYFQKQTRSSVWQAVSLFALGMIGTYVLLGVGISSLMGAGTISGIASNPWVNLGIGFLFIWFALGLMGYQSNINFSMGQHLDNLAKKKFASGEASISWGAMLMGIAFTLIAFTCTMQFVGTLLVSAMFGHWLLPTLGMLMFAIAFALPFLILACFPQFKTVWKTQTWIDTFKKILGLLELAVAIKFISNADVVLGLGIINRSTMLVIWACVAFYMTAFLFGFISIFGRKIKKLSFTHAIGSIFFICIGSYFLVGLRQPLHGWVEAYLPVNLSQHENTNLQWLDTPEKGIKEAKRLNKLVFIDFTGYTCVNCRWMEKNIFSRPEIQEVLENDFVLVQLYTDGGKDYQRWQKMQIQRFQTVALPFYAILTPQNQVVATTAGLTSDAKEFLDFLQVKL